MRFLSYSYLIGFPVCYKQRFSFGIPVLKFKMAENMEDEFGELNELNCIDDDDDGIEWNEIQNYYDNTPSCSASFSNMDRREVLNESIMKAETKKVNDVQVGCDPGPSRMSLNDHKAGMQGLDKEKINKIIYEASKGSKFYDNEMLKERQVQERIRLQTERLESCSKQDMTEAKLQADNIAMDLENTRDLSRIIVHIDMDAFYAAVEMRDDPSLLDKPMAVGGMGMLSTSNYIARRFGVRAAMPGFIGKKLCPELTIVPPNFEKYKQASNIIRNVLKDYDPNFLPMSLDEAYLDLTEYVTDRQNRSIGKTTGNPTDGSDNVVFGNDVEEIVKEIRYRIEKETQLTASAGIACNSMLAKICSDQNKPNGQFYLPSDRDVIMQFVCDLPIRKISGIGRVSEQMLKALGISTCNDLLLKRHILVLLNSTVSSRFLIGISLGLGSTRLESTRERKSLSTERTFTELSKPTELYNECLKLCQIVAKDCNEEKLTPRTVTLKLKTVSFQIKSRSVSLSFPVTSEKDIFDAAKDLLEKEINCCSPKPLRLRLMGVRLSNFDHFDKKDVKQDKITSYLKKDTPDPQCNVNEDRQTSDVSECKVTTSDQKTRKTCFEAVCPVCSQLQIIDDVDYLVVLNKHVDLCLNSVAIKEVLSEQRQSNDSAAAKSGKRKSSSKDTSSQSKRVTLEQFWSK